METYRFFFVRKIGCGKTGQWQDKQEEKDTAAETDSEQGKADQTEQEPVQADKI